MKQQALKYLGYMAQIITPEMNNMIDECIEEVVEYAKFKAIYQTYTLQHSPLGIEMIDLNLDYPAMHHLLDDCHQCLLIACTLGQELEKRIRYYSKFDQARMMVMDAVASSYVEECCDVFEKELKLVDRTYRFCPGYENTPLSINRTIYQTLDVYKHLGVELTEGDLMVPQKSMIGIIGLGRAKKKKECGMCILKQDCSFRRRQTRCYKQD